MVQILHSKQAQHWLVVTNIGVNNSVFVIFDSLLSYIPADIMHQLSVIANLQINFLTVFQAPCPRQQFQGDCGLHAIANATSLCQGKNPCNIYYIQKVMRQHLVKCLSDGEMKEFPASNI